jgi:hypothetical protein
MKQLIGLLMLAISMTSCMNKYDYIEVVEETRILGGVETKDKEAKVIKAKSDSTAYFEAYKDFCISQKVYNDIKQSLGTTYSTPIDFKLMNDKGIDISKNTFFATKEQQEKEIRESIFSMSNSIQESVENNKKEEIDNFNKTAKVDSLKVKELTKFFRIKSDEFSNDNKKWYEPKTAPQYTNRNGIYCYFQTENGIPSNLRFRVQYYAEDWLFFSRIQFSIDGKAFEFIPNDTETDSGNGGYIWEWFDQGLTISDKELIYALANCKNAKMKFIGKQYHDIKTITQEQIKSIKQTIDLYNALGGQY